MTILSVLLTLLAILWQCLTWFLLKVINWNESHNQTTDSYSLSDSPCPSQAELYHAYPELFPPDPDCLEQGCSKYASLTHSQRLRAQARREGGLMVTFFNKSREAFARNDKKLAKELSLKGYTHKENMIRLNKEASAKIFQENNQACGAGTVDLHRLYVQEAKSYFEAAVLQVRKRGGSSLRVIVGKGKHSFGNDPKIKPAIQDLGKSLGMTVKVDLVNSGCLMVDI